MNCKCSWKPSPHRRFLKSHLALDGLPLYAQVNYLIVARDLRSNILPITDTNGYIIASTGMVAGNHNDTFQLKRHLQDAFKSMKQLDLPIQGTYFNADAAFNSKQARKTCFNPGLIPNIAENKRNRKKGKPGPKRFFRPDIYKKRFVALGNNIGTGLGCGRGKLLTSPEV